MHFTGQNSLEIKVRTGDFEHTIGYAKLNEFTFSRLQSQGNLGHV